MNRELVPIATFNTSIEATRAQQILDEQGIESWLQDEAMVNVAWYLTTAIGGIKLIVRENHAKLAIAILEEYQADIDREPLEESPSPTEDSEDESFPELSPTARTLKQAFRAAVIGLIILPLQLYSLWLLLTLLWRRSPLTPRQQVKAAIALGLDLAVLIAIWALIQ